jgi:hypothetical protein
VPSRKKRQLTAAEKRALGATAGLTVTRYAPDGERAEIRQLAPEGPERRRDFIRRLTNQDDVNEASEGG